MQSPHPQGHPQMMPGTPNSAPMSAGVTPVPPSPYGDGIIRKRRPSAQPQGTPDQPRQNKRKKALDRNLPPKIDLFVPESRLYTELQDFEKKLDATISRKRLDIQEAIQRPIKSKRTLRIFLSNTSSGQPWQSSLPMEEHAFDFETGQIPSWTLKIEARLLENTPYRSKHPLRKLSTFLKSVVVELDRDSSLYPEGNLIEWHKSASSAEFDGFEIKRKGDVPVTAKIILQLDHKPERYRLSPELATLLDTEEDTRAGIVQAAWQYIKFHKLQDATDKRIIHCDKPLSQVLGNAERVFFGQIPDMLNRHLMPPAPVELTYTIRTDKEHHMSKQAYDVSVYVEDAVRSKLMGVLQGLTQQKDVSTLDDQITAAVQSVNNCKSKRDFLLSFAESPADFCQRWLASQARDLDIILGESRVGLEEMRKAEFFRQPWVHEVVFHYMGKQTEKRLQELMAQQAPQPPQPHPSQVGGMPMQGFMQR